MPPRAQAQHPQTSPLLHSQHRNRARSLFQFPTASAGRGPNGGCTKASATTLRTVRRTRCPVPAALPKAVVGDPSEVRGDPQDGVGDGGGGRAPRPRLGAGPRIRSIAPLQAALDPAGPELHHTHPRLCTPGPRQPPPHVRPHPAFARDAAQPARTARLAPRGLRRGRPSPPTLATPSSVSPLRPTGHLRLQTVGDAAVPDRADWLAAGRGAATVASMKAAVDARFGPPEVVRVAEVDSRRSRPTRCWSRSTRPP